MGTYSNHPKILSIGVHDQARRVNTLLKKYQLSYVDDYFVFERLYNALIEKENAKVRVDSLIDEITTWIYNDEFDCQWYPDETNSFTNDRILLALYELNNELLVSFNEIFQHLQNLKLYEDNIIPYEYVDYIGHGNIIIELAR